MNRIRAFFARIGTPEPAPPWSMTTGLLVIVVALIAMLIGAAIAVIWGGTQDYVELAGWTLGGILIVVFIWQTQKRDALLLNPPSTPILFVMFVALGCAIALDLISLAVTNQFLPKPELLGLNPSALGLLEWVFAVAFMVIVQPIAEGLVFRTITLPALATLLGSWGGILATALVTGVFHIMIYPPNYNTPSPLTPIWYGLVVPILEALIYSSVRGYTRSNRAAIAAHVAFGIFAVIKLLTLTGAS